LDLRPLPSLLLLIRLQGFELKYNYNGSVGLLYKGMITEIFKVQTWKCPVKGEYS